ncbi:DUF4269 domain-containing protein [Virgibacillus doumboii]|uniref:DUF4269 domain-containing protein n=1 Tax=Virgibacillus doumboii TaxID=2697503 RepID=UPI0013DF3FF1|nr:DUF4269 domain-containing protein [Virgibacillus doumboii]
MFETIDYLQVGNENQKLAYRSIVDLGIMERLSEYSPILCGTLPIGIEVEGSDLDIIMEVRDFDQFEKKMQALFGEQEAFVIKRTVIRDFPVVKANFFFKEFEFELFGQSQPVKKQYAYLHMIVENYLLEQNPALKEEVLRLKKRGWKTEPAFSKALGLNGDPYERLIDFGENEGVI